MLRCSKIDLVEAFEYSPNMKKICEPCTKESKPLSEEEIEQALKSSGGWQRKGQTIEKRYEFKNWKLAFAFLTKVGELAERENHHPDAEIGWGYVVLRFTTHSIGGLHRNDFIMAKAADQL